MTLPDHIAESVERWEQRSFEEEYGPLQEDEYDLDADYALRHENEKDPPQTGGGPQESLNKF
jgi:hypothetical protein